MKTTCSSPSLVSPKISTPPRNPLSPHPRHPCPQEFDAAQLLSVLRDLLCYESTALSSAALGLLVRFGGLRKEVADLVQDVQLLYSSEMSQIYREACMRASRMESLFCNRSNFKVTPSPFGNALCGASLW